MLQKILSLGSNAEHIILTFDYVIRKLCQLKFLCNVEKRKQYINMQSQSVTQYYLRRTMGILYFNLSLHTCAFYLCLMRSNKVMIIIGNGNLTVSVTGFELVAN